MKNRNLHFEMLKLNKNKISSEIKNNEEFKKTIDDLKDLIGSQLDLISELIEISPEMEEHLKTAICIKISEVIEEDCRFIAENSKDEEIKIGYVEYLEEMQKLRNFNMV